MMQELINIEAFTPTFIAIFVWTIFWKGLALWHSASRRQSGWFVVLLVVNTLGILEIVYLFFIAKVRLSELFSKSAGKSQTPPAG
jgi:hypothetical protein